MSVHSDNNDLRSRNGAGETVEFYGRSALTRPPSVVLNRKHSGSSTACFHWCHRVRTKRESENTSFSSELNNDAISSKSTAVGLRKMRCATSSAKRCAFECKLKQTFTQLGTKPCPHLSSANFALHSFSKSKTFWESTVNLAPRVSCTWIL